MTRQIPLLGEDAPETLSVIYHGTPPLVPGPIYTATAGTRIRQIVAWNPGGKPAQLSLQLVRRGGRPGDTRAEILADRLPVDPRAVIELIGALTGGGAGLTLWRGDRLHAEQETEPGAALLIYGMCDGKPG